MRLRKQQVTAPEVQALFPDNDTPTNTATDERDMKNMINLRPKTPMPPGTSACPATNRDEDRQRISVFEVFDNKEFDHARDFKSIETDPEE
jgi:hypothetical protein